MAAWGEGADQVQARHVRRAVADTEGAPPQALAATRPRWLAAALAFVATLAFGLWWLLPAGGVS
jgi:MSHA biogenesis protein MshM